MNVQTYLFFNGTCAEAIALYQKVLPAKLEFFMKFREGPPAQIPPGGEDKVFHATLRIGETLINLADDLKQERGTYGGFVLLLHLDTDAEAERVFHGFQIAGKIVMPIQPTFWASRYGIVTDRFGITWKIQSGK